MSEIPEGQRDFRNWLEYHNRNHPTAQLGEVIAWEIYASYYTCNCEACEQRKRLGTIPMNLGHPGCKAPLESITVEVVNKYLGVLP